MRSTWTLRALAVAGALAAAACYDFDAPIDPDPMHALDPALLGTWQCLSAAPGLEPEIATIAVASAEREHVHALSFAEAGRPPARFEGHASDVLGRTLLNLRPTDTSGETASWTFVRYSFLLPDVVRFELVDDDALAGVEPTPASIRSALEGLDEAPGVYDDFCICTRAKAAVE